VNHNNNNDRCLTVIENKTKIDILEREMRSGFKKIDLVFVSYNGKIDKLNVKFDKIIYLIMTALGMITMQLMMVFFKR